MDKATQKKIVDIKNQLNTKAEERGAQESDRDLGIKFEMFKLVLGAYGTTKTIEDVVADSLKALEAFGYQG